MKRRGKHVGKSVLADVLGLDVWRACKLRSENKLGTHKMATEQSHA